MKSQPRAKGGAEQQAQAHEENGGKSGAAENERHDGNDRGEATGSGVEASGQHSSARTGHRWPGSSSKQSLTATDSRRFHGDHMPTLVLILDDGTERRIPEVARAVENNDAVVALNEHNHVMARFALRDVRSWYVEDQQ
jgi:hypothetical protein